MMGIFMLKNELVSNTNIKKLNKYLSKNEYLFLNRLCFWSSHSNEYGIKIDKNIWIYNTLDNWAEQIKVSKSSVRRAIALLKEKGIITCTQLSPNKRNRTLYYAIDYENIDHFLRHKKTSCVKNSVLITKQNEHMDEHMYIKDNSKQLVNKSNKSLKNNNDQNNFYLPKQESAKNTKQRTTIIQDMLQIWYEEFTKSHVILNKKLARFLVAAFKNKFDSCLEKWQKYLKVLKTSAFIMSNKFKLTIWWVIKYVTIDRIREGWLGVNENKIPVDAPKIYEKTVEHIENIQESQKCKSFRRKIAKALSPEIYMAWFTKVQMHDNTKEIVVETPNDFMTDFISTHFLRDSKVKVVTILKK